MFYDLSSVWKDWKIVCLIGEGSSGKVYEIVRDNMGIEEHSALKVITIPQSQAETRLLRNEGMDEKSVTEYFHSIVKDFIHEVSIMSKLKGNPNIVAYEDYQVVEHKNEIRWDILIRMELLKPFSEFISEKQPDENEVIKLGIEMCEALSVCHKSNIIHRDIKYDNIFVSDNGIYKLGDFGVARTIEKTSGNFSIKGTYTYMAPEVYKGESYGVGADIYSLGMVLYRLLNCNREPFLPLPPEIIRVTDRDNALVKRMKGNEFNLPVNASESMSKIILKACSFKLQDRFCSVDEFKAELNKIKIDLFKSESKLGAEEPGNCIDGILEADKSNDCERTISASVSYCGSKNTPVTENKNTEKSENEFKVQSKLTSKKISNKKLGGIIACCLGVVLIVFIITGVFLNNDSEDNESNGNYSTNVSSISEKEDDYSENYTNSLQVNKETTGVRSDVTVEILDTIEDNGITIDSIIIDYNCDFIDFDRNIEGISIYGECHLNADVNEFDGHGGELLNERGESVDYMTIASESDYELVFPNDIEAGTYMYNFYLCGTDGNVYDATIKFKIY